jgi:hypothetical protein
MRIMIRVELQRTARVEDKKRKVGDILKGNNEGADVRTCRRDGCLEIGHGHGGGLYR